MNLYDAAHRLARTFDADRNFIQYTWTRWAIVPKPFLQRAKARRSGELRHV